MKPTTEVLNYQATVHTQTVKVEPALEDDEHLSDWRNRIINTRYSGITLEGTMSGGYELFINPYKQVRHQYRMEYIGLTELRRRLDRIMQEAHVRSYTIKRLDICIDTTQPFKETAKLTRFIVLLLGEEFRAINRYFSTDPISLESKNVHVSNGQKKQNRTLVVEHYNRELVEQEGWINQVVNRLELRAMGAQAGKTHSIEQIVQNWLKRLDAIDSEARMQKLEQKLNDALYGHLTQGQPLSKAALNARISANTDHIYTADQLWDLYARHGCKDPKHEVRNLKRSYPEAVDSLYTKRQISNAIRQIRQTLTRFVKG